MFVAYQPGISSYAPRIPLSEWESHRATLTQLYRARHSRKHILKIMQRDYDFTPTVGQLSARLSSWGLKNHEKLVKFIQLPSTNSDLEHSTRCDLGCQDVLPQAIPVNDDPSESSSHDRLSWLMGSPLYTPTTSGSDTNGSVTIRTPSSDNEACRNNDEPAAYFDHLGRETADIVPCTTLSDTVEHVLRCIDDCISLFTILEKHRVPGETLYQSISPSIMIERYIVSTAVAYDSALSALSIGAGRSAFQHLKDAATTARCMFAIPTLSVLVKSLDIFSWIRWKSFPGYARVVRTFFAGIAKEQLGAYHPLAKMLSLIASSSQDLCWQAPVWECVVDSIHRVATDDDSRRVTNEMKTKASFYLVRQLRQQKNTNSAIQQSLGLLHHCASVYGVNSYFANRARYALATTYAGEGDSWAAVRLFEEVRRHDDDQGGAYSHQSWLFGMFATSELAQLHEKNGGTQEAEYLYKEAFFAVLKYEGCESVNTLTMLKDLATFYEKQGRQEDITRLRAQYRTCSESLLTGSEVAAAVALLQACCLFA